MKGLALDSLTLHILRFKTDGICVRGPRRASGGFVRFGEWIVDVLEDFRERLVSLLEDANGGFGGSVGVFEVAGMVLESF